MAPQSSRGSSAGKRSISERDALSSGIGAALEAARRAHDPLEATLELLARDDVPARLQLRRDRIAGWADLDIGVAVAVADVNEIDRSLNIVTPVEHGDQGE